MTNSEHPSWKQLLLWQTGELPPEEAQEVQSHLKLCSACREQVDEAESAFEHIAWVDAEAERRRSAASRKNLPARIIQSHPVTITTASVVIAALLLGTLFQWTPQARAESLLDKAVQEQIKEYRPVRFLKVQSGSLSCAVALGASLARPQLVSAGSTNFCENVSHHLASASRQWNSLLSAESFQKWRHSLAKKQDSIHKSDDTIEVSTTTENGMVREASLQLRSSDYRPIAAHFQFAGTDSLSIDVNEDHAAEEKAATEQAMLAKQPQSSAVLSEDEQHPLIDPLDETEAQVRLALHQAQLDRNILLAVERQHGIIRVWGAVPSENDRASAETALNSLAHVNVSLITQAEEQEQRKPLPWSSYQGDDVPLAEEKLTAIFPDGGAERHQFQNDVDALTRRIVGEAKSRDALLTLRSRLSTTQYDEPLERAARDLSDSLRADTLELAGRLAPFTGTVAHARSVMSYQQAMQLYTLVHEMTFMGQKNSHLQLAQVVSRTRRLLTRN